MNASFKDLYRNIAVLSRLPVFKPCSCSKGGLLELGLRIVEIARKYIKKIIATNRCGQSLLQPALRTLKKDGKGI